MLTNNQNICQIGKYYLYRHIRLDKNEPFYIGIGTKQSKDPYSRSKDHINKNNIWKKIVAKTNYEVEIVMESNDDYFIQEKEKEFIKLYGRICENKGGTLANIESGGRNGVNYNTAKKIYCCNNNKKYTSIKEASIDLELDGSSISRVALGETNNTKGYIFKERCEDCLQSSLDEMWFPIIDEKYGYYINKEKEIKRIFIIFNNEGYVISKKERVLKPIFRKNKKTIQLTISHQNKQFTVNLKKEYNAIFGVEWKY